MDRKLWFFHRGEELYADLERRLRAARSEILLNSYAFHNDPSGRRVADLLGDRAKAGIRVRVIFDEMGSWGDQQDLARRITRGGGEVRIFRPRPAYLYRHPVSYLYRNHARLILIDREVLGLGGMGVGEIYRKREDLFVFVRPAAADPLAHLFQSLWQLASAPGFLPVALSRPLPIAPGMSALVSGPTAAEEAVYAWLVARIAGAQRRIAVCTAWFVPDLRLLRLFAAARKRGVDITVVTPLATDRQGYDSFRALPIERLLRRGVRWYGTPQYFHQKFVLVDDDWCLGSANFDILSLKRNYELNLAGTGGEMLQELEQSIRHLTLGEHERRETSLPWAFRLLGVVLYGTMEFFMTAGLRRRRPSPAGLIPAGD